MIFLRMFVLFLVAILLQGCINEPERSSTFYITPLIEGAFICEEALNHKPSFNTANEAINWCSENEYNGASLLTQKLETLEPGGPQGSVQIGYQLGISLLNLYEYKNGHWEIDNKKVDSYFDIISNVERPVVIYLMANHFDTTGGLQEELSKDEENLLLLKDGEPPMDNYFGNSVIPFTLLTDESIDVNHYRFEALRHISKQITDLPQDVRERIVGITLAGEIHHLYPDFTNGAGESKDFFVTDYSSRSAKEFQGWLESKYDTITNLNSNIGSDFDSFENIEPPSKNIHIDKLNSFTEHYDAYAAGEVPISGWLWDPKSVVNGLKLYIDGEQVDNIKQGFHRLDVYRAVEEIPNPNVGFRYNLDYTSLSHGKHNIHVVAESRGEEYLIGQSTIVVVDRSQGEALSAPEDTTEFKDAEELGIKFWLDEPLSLTALYFNPLAKDWNEFREHQVTDFLNYFYNVAVESGLPEEKLFSHQIYSKINSSWNYQLFMEETSVGKNVPYKLGINFYGGATNSDLVRDFLENRETDEYGVPEFHIQQWKSADVASNALKAQYQDGAKFISPYYISIIPDFLMPSEVDTLQKFHIRPDNTLEGSNLLYEAIVDFANQ